MFNRETALTSSELKSAIIRDPLIVEPDTTVMNAIAQMSGQIISQTADRQLDQLHLKARSNSVLVVEDRRLVGIFTERDVVQLIGRWQPSLENLAIREVMRYPVVTLRESAFTNLFVAINLFEQYHIRHIPILDEQDRLVGLLTDESLRQVSRLVQERTQELWQLNSLQQAILNSTDYSIISIAPTGIIQTFNAGAERMLGYSAAEIVGKATPELFHDRQEVIDRAASLSAELGQEVAPSFQAVVTTAHQGIVSEEEWLHIRKDGSRFPVLLSITPLKDAHQQVIGFLGIAKDISDRKRAERQLQDSEAKLQAVLNFAPSVIYVKDLEGRHTLVNQAFLKLFGCTTADIIGKTNHEFFPTEVADRIQANDQAVLSDGKIRQVEEEILIGDTIHTFLSNKFLLRNGNGQPYAIGGISTNITNIKQAELQRQQLVQELSAFKLALDKTAIVAITDAQGVITYVNDRFCTISEYSRAELIGQTHRIIKSDYHPPSFFQDLWRTITRGKIWRGEVCNQSKHGHLYWVESAIVPFADEQGRPFQYLTIRFDITARKLAKAKLQQENIFREQIVENMTEGLCVCQELKEFPFMRVTVWNRQMQTITGYSLEEINSLGWYQSLYPAPELQAQAIARMWQIQAGENLIAEEWEIQRQDGQKRTISISTSLLSSDDEQNHILALIQDITDRKRAEETIRQQAEEETLLREITQRIRQSLDLQTIFDTACQEIREVIDADRVGIFKFYPEANFDDGEFVAESVVEGFPSVVAIRVHDHCFGDNYSSLYAQGKSFVVDDIYNGGMTTCHTNILAQFQVMANLIMPLLCGNHLWGLLCIHQCASTRHWEESEIDFTQQLANQLAIAIQQANLYEQIQSELLVRQQAEARIALELRRQQTLGAIVKQIRDSLDVNEILATVTQQVKEVLHSDRVIVFRIWADGGSQIVEEAVSEEFSALKNYHWDSEVWSPEVLECYWQGQPRIVLDVMNDIWTDCLRSYSRSGQIQSKIVAPILQEVRSSENHRWVSPKKVNKLWGVLVVHACGEKRVWKDSEAQLLQQIADQLAIAIQQASFFEQLQQELSERQLAESKLTESNQQLAISNEELARATRLKDEFLANMSHELRTPLNAILGMTEGLQEGVFGPINQPQLKALQTIERSGSHLLELIDDILDVAKIEAGQIQLDLTSVSGRHLCQSSLAFIKQQALKKRIQLEIKLQENLPDLLVDERRIRQVLINLLNNAVKFTPEGGRITLEVSQIFLDLATTDSSPQHFLRFAVIDTGIGITPENIKKLFQPFIQIDSALNRQYSGTGLGLVLVKRIVELHSGRVELTSELGAGSCFAIELPCILGSPLLPKITATTTTSLDANPTNQDLTQPPLILLAEDNEANISTFSSYLRAKGYQILLAKNGQEAIDMAVMHQPDLILMDIQMPGMDGLEAMKQIRLHPNLADILIITLTALAMTGDRDRCLAAGANEYLAKPVRLKTLSQMIQTLLASKKNSTTPP